MKLKFGDYIYYAAFAVGVWFLANLTFVQHPTFADGRNAFIAFAVGVAASLLEKGNKTALQKIFLCVFGLFATGAVITGSILLWILAGGSMFLMATMKIDGGDRDNG